MAVLPLAVLLLPLGGRSPKRENAARMAIT